MTKTTKAMGRQMRNEMSMMYVMDKEITTREVWTIFRKIRKFVMVFGYAEEFDLWIYNHIASTEMPYGNWIWHRMVKNPLRTNWNEIVQYPLLLNRSVVFGEIPALNRVLVAIALEFLAGFLVHHSEMII